MPSYDELRSALWDKDVAAETIEPLVTVIIDQLASDAGLETLQGLLPIDVSVTVSLQSGERMLAAATMKSRIDALDTVS